MRSILISLVLPWLALSRSAQAQLPNIFAADDASGSVDSGGANIAYLQNTTGGDVTLTLDGNTITTKANRLNIFDKSSGIWVQEVIEDQQSQPIATLTPTSTPSPTPTSTPSHSLGNISTRGLVGIGDQVMIGGFIISGTGDKKVLLRAIGPSLSNPPVSLTGTLQDPTISLFNVSGKLTSNDNWADASNAQSIDPGLRPTSGLESAILISLPPGAYTAIVSGVGGGTGIGLVEVFDMDATVPSKLSNMSTRGLVETGDNVLIGGLIVKGPESETVVVRAIGPSLAAPPINLTNVLQNPSLGLFNDQGSRIQFNDDWQSDQANDIIATGLQPSNPAESAIVRTLTPGNYTAIVTGVNGTTGIALVEVYERN